MDTVNHPVMVDVKNTLPQDTASALLAALPPEHALEMPPQPIVVVSAWTMVRCWLAFNRSVPAKTAIQV